MYYEEEYDSAHVMFKEFVNDYPTSSLLPRVKYNIGYILKQVARDEESIPIFEKLLACNYNDKKRFLVELWNNMHCTKITVHFI